MKHFALFVVLALVGCDSAPAEHRPGDSGEAAYTRQLVNGNRIVDFHLADGTRCVTVSDKSITCDWRHP